MRYNRSHLELILSFSETSELCGLLSVIPISSTSAKVRADAEDFVRKIQAAVSGEE